jgi:hypothetical protein
MEKVLASGFSAGLAALNRGCAYADTEQVEQELDNQCGNHASDGQ